MASSSSGWTAWLRRRASRPPGRGAPPRIRAQQVRSTGNPTPAAPVKGWVDIATGFGQIATAVAAIGALIFTASSLSATRDDLRITEQGQITDRFARAVEQLGEPGPDRIDVRLGGIYALERIMRDSPADQPTVVEVLAAFVRVHAARTRVDTSPQPTPSVSAPASTTASSSVPVDIQAAITVLGRRDPARDRISDRIDLRRTLLAHGNLVDGRLDRALLSNADLSRADLSSAELSLANLTNANLTNASLHEASLDYANLTDADLRGADLSGANLSGANLSRANLSGANLLIANLAHTFLGGANLTGADLSGANLSAATMAPEALRCARVTDTTKLPANVVRPRPDAPTTDPTCKPQ